MAPLLLPSRKIHKTLVLSPARRLFIIGTLGTALLSVHVQSANNQQTVKLSQHVEASPQEKSYGGTLSIGMYYPAGIINPVLASQGVSIVASSLVFNRLLRINPEGELEPDLVESWEVSPDGLNYTFFLRKGVLFHDGVELTAEDVLFTYDKMRDPDTRSPYVENFSNVARCEAVDRYTFRISLREPSAPFIFEATREILPRRLYGQGDFHASYYNHHPVGTGPFKYKGWAEGADIILEANPGYFEGRPYLDRVVIKSYANRREVWSALMRGEVDLNMFLEVSDYEVVKRDRAFKAFEHTAPYYYAVLYDLNDPILNDKKVREAIACAVDRRQMIQRVEMGYGTECTGPFSPESWGYNPQVEPIAYEPRRALGLLNEAGWKDADADGILEREGQELVIRMLVDARQNKMSAIAALLRQELQKAGIKLEIVRYEGGKLTSGYLSALRIQAQLALLYGGGLDPSSVMKVWHSGTRRADLLLPYRSSALDQLLDAAHKNKDEELRLSKYRKVHEIIYQDQPACFLYFEVFMHAVSSRIEGAEFFLNSHMPTYTIKDFYVDKREAEYAKRR